VINIITLGPDTIGGFGTIASGVEARPPACATAGAWAAPCVYMQRPNATTSPSRWAVAQATPTAASASAARATGTCRRATASRWRPTSTAAASGAYQPTATVPASRLLSPAGSFRCLRTRPMAARIVAASRCRCTTVFTRDEYSRIEDRTTDVVQHRTHLGDAHDLVWGMNWRHRVDASTSSRFDVFAPPPPISRCSASTARTRPAARGGCG
jgi:hypothetical protein